ncbi:pentapeptide repeat-containing protein [Rhodococcus sp. NPDC003348]
MDLAGQNLSGLDLSGDNFFEAILSETDLSSVRFQGGNLARADLSESDLSDAVLGQRRS